MTARPLLGPILCGCGIEAIGRPVAFGALFITDDAIAMSGGDAHFDAPGLCGGSR